MKRLFLLILIVLLAGIFAGCAEVELRNDFYSNKVVQTVKITITEDNKELYGYSKEEILTLAAQILGDFGRKITRTENSITATKEFSSQAALVEDVIGSGYTAARPTAATAGFFFDTYKSYCVSRFSDTNQWALADFILNEYLDDISIAEEEAVRYALSAESGAVDYVFKYGTQYGSLSTNGETEKEGGLYVHTWNIKPDTQLYFERKSENQPVWYAFLIGGGLIFVVVLYAVSQRTKRNGLRPATRTGTTATDGGRKKA
ncbi:MAG: hypothetical protein LBT55_07940 [Clostridiaceae bacterium]|jgi:hypothetical protein|nr:hypothetical protein [Clostridiaceae bacterium]